MSTKYATGASLLKRLVDMEAKLTTIEGAQFYYKSPGPFNGMAASQRIYNIATRISVLEGTAAPPIPAGWIQGRSQSGTLDDLSARIAALQAGPSLPIAYPLTIFNQALTQSPSTPNNWSARQIVSITNDVGPQGQVRCTFDASAAKDFRINNASIGVSVMKDKFATPDNGATVNVPVPLFSTNVYVPAGGQSVSNWVNLPFTKDKLLVVIIDHNTDTGNPKAATGLGGFPNGTRQGYQTSTTSYSSKLPLTTGVDGQIYALSKIEVR